MDDYLEQYVENIMEKQVYRNGIDLSPSWLRKIFSRRSSSK